MQGTILVQFSDGGQAFFNVDRNNGIPFVKGVSPYEQRRYWYFREVAAIKGYGSTIENKINIEPEVTFAGDVWNIGLGRVVVIEDTRGTPQNCTLRYCRYGGSLCTQSLSVGLFGGDFS